MDGPVPQQQVGLDGLSSDVAQAGRYDRDSQGLRCASLGLAFRRGLPPFRKVRGRMGHPAWALLLYQPDLEVCVTLAHAIEAELFLCGLAGVAGYLLVKGVLAQH